MPELTAILVDRLRVTFEGRSWWFDRCRRSARSSFYVPFQN